MFSITFQHFFFVVVDVQITPETEVLLPSVLYIAAHFYVVAENVFHLNALPELHALYKRKYSLCWELFILWLIASLLFKQIRLRRWFPKWGGASPRERCSAVASGKATALWLPRSLNCRLTRGVGRSKMESVCKYVMSQNWNSVFRSKRNLYMWRTFPGRGHKCAGSTVRHFYKRSLPQSTAAEQFLTKC